MTTPYTKLFYWTK